MNDDCPALRKGNSLSSAKIFRSTPYSLPHSHHHHHYDCHRLLLLIGSEMALYNGQELTDYSKYQAI